MFKNLKAEMARNNLNLKQFSTEIGIKYSTLCQKFKGKVDFTLAEALTIKCFFDNLPIEYLFAKDDVQDLNPQNNEVRCEEYT